MISLILCTFRYFRVWPCSFPIYFMIIVSMVTLFFYKSFFTKAFLNSFSVYLLLAHFYCLTNAENKDFSLFAYPRILSSPILE